MGRRAFLILSWIRTRGNRIQAGGGLRYSMDAGVGSSGCVRVVRGFRAEGGGARGRNAGGAGLPMPGGAAGSADDCAGTGAKAIRTLHARELRDRFSLGDALAEERAPDSTEVCGIVPAGDERDGAAADGIDRGWERRTWEWGSCKQLVHERGATGLFCDYRELLKQIQNSIQPAGAGDGVGGAGTGV